MRKRTAINGSISNRATRANAFQASSKPFPPHPSATAFAVAAAAPLRSADRLANTHPAPRSSIRDDHCITGLPVPSLSPAPIRTPTRTLTSPFYFRHGSQSVLRCACRSARSGDDVDSELTRTRPRCPAACSASRTTQTPGGTRSGTNRDAFTWATPAKGTPRMRIPSLQRRRAPCLIQVGRARGRVHALY